MDESLRPQPFLNIANVFRILLVDDDPAAARLFQELMKNLHRRHELHFARDGVEALEFLHRRGSHAAAPRPDLILLDINMPRLGGLETLVAIKSDPLLCVIPVIMLSTSGAPDEVWRSYRAQANCYVQKPTNLDQTVKLVQAVEAFWMEFALLPEFDGKRQFSDLKREAPLQPERIHSGPPIAPQSEEARSRATSRSGCEEYQHLLDEFGVAVRELIELHQQQYLAIVEGDSECHRFDLLIHMATEKKQMAKYACLRHVEEHGCSKFNALDHART
jgi:CheY-like chemotaxis protein